MKICFITGTLARGGAEKQLVFMLRALRNLRTEAEVLCLTEGESYGDEIRELGFDVKYVGASSNRFARLWKIISSLRSSKADIIQSSHFYTNLYAGFAGRYLNIPSIGAVRSDLDYELESHRFTGRLQISLPNILLTNSALAQRQLRGRRIGPQKVEVVRNVVEVERVPADRVRGEGLRLLFVGRLDKNKRPERFIHLASVLAEQHRTDGLEFQVAGNGEMLEELKRTAELLGLGPDSMVFLGDCDRMSQIYRQADILVSTSDREGTPNVILEAMSYGLPVVATAVGGTVEILDHTRGILVEPGDERSLVSAASGLIRNKGLRLLLGAEGKRYVLENHSLERLQTQLHDVYDQLLMGLNARRTSIDFGSGSIG